jgi:hypothetical protein
MNVFYVGKLAILTPEISKEKLLEFSCHYWVGEKNFSHFPTETARESFQNS